MTDQLLTPKQVSAQLGGIPEKTLTQWRYLGVGPAYVKIGRHIRYRPQAVERWIADRTVTTDAPR